MRRLICSVISVALCSVITANAQQASGAGEVVRPRTTEEPGGVKLIGCVQAETRPNAFRLVVSPPAKEGAAAKLPKGIKPGASIELVARGETNLQPMASQKVEVTGRLANDNRRLNVLDARALGPCEGVVP